jgi:hypothetical protein
MTAYNREPFIADAIESVLAQTFEDFELIIVDDGSKDHTIEIARRYTSDRRVQVHVNKQNLGDYPNRNRAASIAQGRYLKYLDADDMMYPHCLEVLAGSMERFPGVGLGLATGLGKEWYSWSYPVVLSPLDAYRLEFLGPGALSYGPTFSILRRQTFLDLGGFAGDRMTGDVELALRIAQRNDVLFAQPGLVFYRSHEGQESTWGTRQIEVSARYFRIRRQALLHPDCPLTGPEQKLALQNLVGQNLRVIARDVLRGHLRTAMKRWELGNLTVSSLSNLAKPSRFPLRGRAEEFHSQTGWPKLHPDPLSTQPCQHLAESN